MTQRSHDTAQAGAPSRAEVIPFVIGWTAQEKAMLYRFCADLRARNLATHSEIGHTDRNEPQFYVFNGVLPDASLTVSRIVASGKRRYLIENRYGQVLTTGASLRRVIFNMLHQRARLRNGAKLCLAVAALAEMTIELGMLMNMTTAAGGFI